VTEGTNTIVGGDPDRILKEARRVLSGEGKDGRVPRLWDGRAAARIVDVLERDLGGGA
jgi:UDP-N-acetylglucosamine 2-epimerase (non-hydrolysing)